VADGWKFFERTCLGCGLLISAATLYYTAAPYYERLREIHPAPLPPANVEVITTTPPWWLIALGTIGVLLLVTGWAMMALRRRTPGIHGRMFPIEIGVYIGQISVSIDKLDSDLFMEIGILGYNGTTKFISIESVQGTMVYENDKLPTPAILADRSPTTSLAAAKEFLLVLEQRVPRNIADKILSALNAKKRVSLNLDLLNILAFFPPNREQTTRLPLWYGMTIDLDEKPRVGKIISASIRIKL
jgi:hypothetical protein